MVMSFFVFGDELLLKYFKLLRKFCIEECMIFIRLLSICNDDLSFSNLYFVDVNFIDDLIGNENLDGLEVV